jgi:hypothetical protein
MYFVEHKVMPTITKETKRLLYYSDLLIANFWRYLVQSLWLFFPPIIFLILAYCIFWHLPQGKDLIVISLQNAKFSQAIFPCFILALIFWVYVTWYSTRIVARANHFVHPNHHNLATVFRIQTPRILAFTCITIIFLALFQLENPAYSRWQISSFWCHILFLLSFSWYFIIWRFWTWYLQKKNKKKDWLKFLLKARLITYSLLITAVITVMIVRNFWGLVVFLVLLQMGLVLSLILRRDITEARGETVNYISPKRNNPSISPRSSIWKKMHHIVANDDDDRYFLGFNIISSLAAIVYIGAIASVKISVTIGSFPFVLLAFGVLLGIGNFITLISVFARFNFHLVLFLLALFLGHFVDPHFATVVKKKNTNAYFTQRQDIREYFLNWLTDDSRKASINNADSAKKYPIYFVMANGGASRSGYWTASILASFEDTTKQNFSRHLFCLSGASGGSVGTTTFFSLLRANKDELKKKFPGTTPMTQATSQFLESDFLTYTLTHLLGPDIFRHIVPLKFVDDRAEALAHSIERASGKNSFLYDSFAVTFSSLITQKGQRDYHLPILCINTTRMQDGSPGVVSNINIKQDSVIFNNRVDVLGLLNENEDMKLSTAVVLGASFPYISPAGRINSQLCPDCECQSHYFVDGGYFDNSGAGVVNEMMIAMNNLLINDPVFKPYKNKIEFHVIHISNTEPKKLSFGQINPITNDLLAPVKTLLGSYGTQTTINDQRLKNFLFNLYGDDTHYTNIDLYKNNPHIRYSMNWVISKSQLDSMTSNLRQNTDIHKVYEKMKLNFDSTSQEK